MQPGPVQSSSPSVPPFVELPEDFTTKIRSADLLGSEESRHEREIDSLSVLLGPAGTAGQAVFLGALCAFLHRYTHQERIPLDVNVVDGAGTRRRRMALMVSVAGQDAVSSIVARIAEEIATTPRSAPRPAVPSSNVAVTFVGAPGVTPLAKQDDVGAPLADGSYTLHFVAFVARSPDRAPSVVLRYDPRKFRSSTALGMLDSFAELLDAVVGDSNAPVHRLPLRSAVAVRAFMADWGVPTSAPTQPVHRAFEARARERPEAVAARFGDVGVTYGELEARSNRLAHYLVSRGVTPGDKVAVCVLPSFDVLVALLATWKAGAVYVPLDPTHPKALTTGILEEAKPRIVLTQPETFDCPSCFEQFLFDADGSSVGDFPASAPAVEVRPSDPSHVFYTSGTTGKPKGVLATHRNLSHYTHVARDRYGFAPSDVFSVLARYTFSISLFELVSPLVSGASLLLLSRDDVLSPERLARALDGVTVVHAGPSLLGSLFRHLAAHRLPGGERRTFPRMRHASSGGDLVPPHVLEDMKRAFPSAELYVIYGCTEISCMGCTYAVPLEESVTRNLVGRPFAGVTVRLLDAHGNVVPFGVKGEICFAGPGVVEGYVDRPELTEQKFVEIEGQRFYRTGDLGRLHPDGNIEILGRQDFQVQIRGIRVELAGIENTIRARGLAAQCAVIARRQDQAGQEDVRLVAYCVAPAVSDVAAFRRALAETLPDYMLPQKLVVLPALPLTHNGKLDRRRLAELPLDTGEAAFEKELPRNRLERKVAEAFAATLELGPRSVGLDDDFFDLGGHSLLAVLLLDHLENELGLSLPPNVVFETPTVRALAERAERAFPDAARPIALGQGTGGTLFLLAGVHVYRALAQRLEGRFSTFAVYVGRELVSFDTPESAPSVEWLAREYLELMRRQQPEGPYRLAGLSFGGIVAHEIARRLEAAGERVEFLGLLDAILPEPGLRGRLARLRRLSSLDRRSLGVLARRRWFGSAIGSEGDPNASLIRHADDERLRPMEDRRQKAYRRAAASYVAQLRPYRGRTTLIVAGRRAREDVLNDPHCGWTRHLPELEVHTLDSEHLALLEEPHVESVARIFLEAMNAPSGSPERSAT